MKTRKRVTIKDVAQDTGFAYSTVSNALSGKAYVRQKTREIVMDSVARLGYRASAVARSMRLQRSSSIGVMIADVANPSSADFVRGVEDVLYQADCTMLLCNTDGIESLQLKHMQTLLDHRVDGIVMISQHFNSAEILELLSSAPPVVMVQRRGPLEFDYVGSDNEHGILDAMQHLSVLGHKRIGFVRGPQGSSSADERLITFRKVSQQLGFDTDERLIYQGDYSFDSGKIAGAYFMRQGAMPTAIMASSDMNAMGMMQYLMEVGISIPKDISIIGLDDIVLADFKTINLTTIHLEKRKIGQEAASALIRRIENPKISRQEVILPTRLIVRGSTCALK